LRAREMSARTATSTASSAAASASTASTSASAEAGRFSLTAASQSATARRMVRSCGDWAAAAAAALGSSPDRAFHSALRRRIDDAAVRIDDVDRWLALLLAASAPYELIG
jgi:hypothetical protein